jgi:hypothetical protein
MKQDAERVRKLLEKSGIDLVQGWPWALGQFVERFPRSHHRDLVDRELFRDSMRQCYPSRPGNTIQGKVYPAGGRAESGNVGDAVILVDRFAVATTDGRGEFVARGIPVLEVPVTLPLSVRSDSLRMVREVAVRLPPRRPEVVRVGLPVGVSSVTDEAVVSLTVLIDELLRLRSLGEDTADETSEPAGCEPRGEPSSRA